MRKLAVALCLATLILPAQARRRFAPTLSHPATVQPGFSPTMPYGPNGTIQPASTGYSSTGSVPNRTLNSGYGVRRGYGRRGYYRNYYSSGFSSGGGAASHGIPGYDTPLPQRTLPGY